MVFMQTLNLVRTSPWPKHKKGGTSAGASQADEAGSTTLCSSFVLRLLLTVLTAQTQQIGRSQPARPICSVIVYIYIYSVSPSLVDVKENCSDRYRGGVEEVHRDPKSAGGHYVSRLRSGPDTFASEQVERDQLVQRCSTGILTYQ